MNIDNLNPDNNNQSNVNPVEPNIEPVEPTFGNPPIPGPMDASVSVTPTPGPMDIPPSPMPTPGPMDTSSSFMPTPGPMDTPSSPIQTPGPINLAPEGVVSNSPVVDPLSPLVSAPLNSNTPLTGNVSNQNNNLNVDSVNNAINEIPTNPQMFGGVPTPSEAPIIENSMPNKSKKKKNKVLIIILILVLILGIGGGVYYFLNIANAKPSVSVIPTLSQWELGTKLSTNAEDYAQINGVEASSCTVNVDAVNINITGTYSFNISCPGLGEPVVSTIEVRDTKGPEVTLKEVTVKPNTEVLVEDFIAKCVDPSVSKECDVSISDSSIDLEEIVKEEGTYKIPLVVKDDYNHETAVEATLKVDENAPTEFLTCELAEPHETTINADISESFEYGLNDASEISTIKRVINYSFKDQEEYEQVKKEYATTKFVDGLSGDVQFDDKKFVIILEVDVSLDDLQEELESDTELKTYEDVAIFHDDKNDICSLS